MSPGGWEYRTELQHRAKKNNKTHRQKLPVAANKHCTAVYSPFSAMENDMKKEEIFSFF